MGTGSSGHLSLRSHGALPCFDMRLIPLISCLRVLQVTFVERNFVPSDVVEHSSHLLHLAIASELLMVVNSSANFIVYVAFGRRFRRVMRDTFRFSFRFSSAATAVTRDSPQGAGAGGGGGGGWPAYAAQQYHHNCVHAPRAPQPPMALRPMIAVRWLAYRVSHLAITHVYENDRYSI